MTEKTLENQMLQHIGCQVKRYRKERQLSQKKLAEMVLVSSSCITRLEKGETMVSFFTLVSIADALQVPLSVLISENAEFDLSELESLVNKISRCPQKQRDILIHSFEQIIDAIFLES